MPQEPGRVSEAWYRTVLDTAMDGWWVIDLEGNLVEVNQTYCEMSGYTQEELLGLRVQDLDAYEGAGDSEAHIQRIVERGVDRFESRHRRKDGTEFEVEVSVHYIDVDGGRIAAFLRDVTAQNQVAATCRISEKALAEAQRVAAMGSWEWDAVADVVTWSRELYLTFELNPKLPPPPYDGQLALYAPESAARLDAAVQQALATGQSYQLDLEQSPYNCPGRWVAARGEVKRDDTGAIVGIQGTIQDITERKRAEEELRQSQMLLKSSVESQKDTIFLSVDTSYRYLYFNPAHAAMAKAAYGIEIELGMVCLDVVTNEQDRRTIQADLERALCGESHTELQVYGWDQPMWFETFFNPVFGPGGEIVGSTALSRDVTQRVLSERQLLDANAKLTEMVYATADAIGRIAEARDPYTMGHERRVAELAVLLAQEMNLPAETIAGIEMAGMLHDIGKVAVPSEILTKPGKISSAEFELIKQHPQKGFDIIRSIEFPWPVADSALQHHERMDGTGYPQGLTAEQICLEARVLAVADVVEAMASHRPYRAALGLDVAVEEIESHPQQYDPQVVSALLALYGTGQLEEWRAAGVARRTD